MKSKVKYYTLHCQPHSKHAVREDCFLLLQREGEFMLISEALGVHVHVV